MLDVSYPLFVTLLLGAVFHWYRSTPVWVLVVMVFVIYLVGYLTDLYRTKEEVRMNRKVPKGL